MTGAGGPLLMPKLGSLVTMSEPRLERQNLLILLLATENPWKSITVRNLEII